MIPSLPSDISHVIETRTGSVITGFSFSSGGCINHGGKLSTTRGVYFLKWNDARKYPGMFKAEADGLDLLHRTDALPVPGVVLTGETETNQFLLLELISAGPRGSDYWRRLGTGLARLHGSSDARFGLPYDNYIGSLPQRNTQKVAWPEFFVECRLRCQLELAGDKLEKGTRRKFDTLFAMLPDLLPDEPPSLLHGDLWGGNVMTTAAGDPCLIDPAVYYGHREVDLAMTQLFGGFDPDFLSSYRDAYPLMPGYRDRFDLYNVYPLLVHVNLFGGGYAQQLSSILDRFV